MSCGEGEREVGAHSAVSVNVRATHNEGGSSKCWWGKRREKERTDGRTAISAETNNDDDGSMLCTHQHSELLLRRPLPPRTSKYYCVRYIYREACDV